jgi:hypothetical protein
MPSEQIHDIPGRGQVNVVDPDSARDGLQIMLQRFRDGVRAPLIFGDGKPEGVVIAFDEWLELLDAAEDAAASARVQETTRQRLDTPREDYVPIEDLGIDLDDEARDRGDG